MFVIRFKVSLLTNQKGNNMICNITDNVLPAMNIAGDLEEAAIEEFDSEMRSNKYALGVYTDTLINELFEQIAGDQDMDLLKAIALMVQANRLHKEGDDILTHVAFKKTERELG